MRLPSLYFASLILLILGCRESIEPCDDFIKAEDIVVSEFLDPDPSIRIDRRLIIEAAVDQKDLGLAYTWNINNETYSGSQIELTGNGVVQAELIVSNPGCSVVRTIYLDFDRPSGTLGCQVWTDSRNNVGVANMFDATDVAMQDVIVELLDANNLEVKQIDTTDITGRYFFLGVPSGEYIIKVNKPDANTYLFLPANAGDEDSDCDIIDEQGMTSRITLKDWEVKLDVGAGFRRCYIQDITCDNAHPCFGRVSTDDIEILFDKDALPGANGNKTIRASAEIPHPVESTGIEYTWYINNTTYTGQHISVVGQGIQKAVLTFSKGGCSISRDMTFDFS